MERKPKKSKADGYRSERVGFRVTKKERNLYEEVRVILSNRQEKFVSLADMISLLVSEKLEELQAKQMSNQ